MTQYYTINIKRDPFAFPPLTFSPVHHVTHSSPPLSLPPKQFLGDSHPPEDGSELAKLQEALGGGPATNLTEAEVFWLSLPRSPSHRAAVFTLPVQMNRLVGRYLGKGGWDGGRGGGGVELC